MGQTRSNVVGKGGRGRLTQVFGPDGRNGRQRRDLPRDLHRRPLHLGPAAVNDAADEPEPVGRARVEETAGQRELAHERVVAGQLWQALERADVGRHGDRDLLRVVEDKRWSRGVSRPSLASRACSAPAETARTLIENLASAAHRRTSQAEMMSTPSPMQRPWTAAMTGTRQAAMLLMASWKSCRGGAGG